ncbi:MAG TPA: DUF503 domain-containing protein [Firmicutes bacterium]|nr:DUF503 domain-containing protein [Candidatus Fermentithermobacillaceae bacterium]
MVVGTCVLKIVLPGVQSLKEKRQRLGGLVVRVRRKFNVACAELEDNDTYNHATLGLACVSNRRAHAEQVIRSAAEWIESNVDGEVSELLVEIL